MAKPTPTPAAPKAPATQNVNQVQTIFGMGAIKAIIIAVLALVTIGFLYDLTWGSSETKPSESSAPAAKTKTPWVVVNLGKSEPTPKPAGKEVKIRTNTAKWSPVFETKVGESVTYSFPGRVAIRTNISYGGGKVFQYDDKIGKYYELGKNNRPMVEELTGKPITTLDLGDNVSELEFLSLDVDKVVTVVVTR